MKIAQLIFFFLSSAIAGYSQDFVEVSYGAGYSQQVFVELKTKEQVTFDNTAWDIAFSLDSRGAGVLINEATGSNGTQLELYQALTTNFDDTIKIEELGAILYNSETDWESGAFNSIAPEGDPFSFGWGSYNPQNHHIEGNAVFVLKLRDETYKKVQIVSLISGVYTLKYANLDGSDQVIFTIDKNAHGEEKLAYYSFTSNTLLGDVPSTWDLLFTRYVTPLDDGEGGVIDYLLTGVLSNTGVQVAKLEGVDPVLVKYEDVDSLDSRLDAIGYDWKSFDLATFQWAIPDDLVYFVKTADEKIYKLQFIDFEGSSTGNAVFSQEEISNTTAVFDVNSNVEDLAIFPNPAKGAINMAYSVKNKGKINLQLSNVLGQKIWGNTLNVPAGFNTYQIPDLNLAKGTYWLNIQSNGTQATEKIIIR